MTPSSSTLSLTGYYDVQQKASILYFLVCFFVYVVVPVNDNVEEDGVIH